MKILTFIFVALATIGNASTITVHGFRDNYLAVTAGGPALVCIGTPEWILLGMNDPEDVCQYYQLGRWDFDNDALFPEYAYSGFESATNHCIGMYDDTYTLGWTEAITFSGDLRRIQYTITGPSPDYRGTWFVAPLTVTDSDYWIDFDSGGSPRVSGSLPPDFGKWAWNGSINPNYVEPMALKSKGNKHRK